MDMGMGHGYHGDNIVPESPVVDPTVWFCVDTIQIPPVNPVIWPWCVHSIGVQFGAFWKKGYFEAFAKTDALKVGLAIQAFLQGVWKPWCNLILLDAILLLAQHCSAIRLSIYVLELCLRNGMVSYTEKIGTMGMGTVRMSAYNHHGDGEGSDVRPQSWSLVTSSFPVCGVSCCLHILFIYFCLCSISANGCMDVYTSMREYS